MIGRFEGPEGRAEQHRIFTEFQILRTSQKKTGKRLLKKYPWWTELEEWLA